MSALPVDFFAVVEATKVAESGQIVWVSVPEQRLRLFVHRIQTAAYLVSTAANGVGCRVNSYQTPTGLHRIARKIGDEQPLGMMFKERKPTTLNAQRSTLNEDLILTRILWLEGLQPGVNHGGEVDTFSRFIYIHGTNHEELLGQPASHGCIRMSNPDVLLLFDTVETGSLVWIM